MFVQSKICSVLSALLVLAAIALPRASLTSALSEQDRLREYHARNYTWPIPEYKPNTPGWRKLFDHRFRQAAEIDNANKRYEAFLQTVNAAFVAPNFTTYGFGLARAPDELMEALRKGVRDGVAAGPRLEPSVEVIEGDQPWFVDRPDLTKRVRGNKNAILFFLGRSEKLLFSSARYSFLTCFAS